MSGYGYSSGDQSGYYAQATAYPVPQYTQSQINAYYQQYGCYPPQPYQVIADSYYAQPAAVVPSSYTTTASTTSGYTSAYAGGNLAIVPETQRTWRCDLPNCTSSANFTRLADLQRHQSTVHGVGTPDFPCTVKDCTRVGDKGFTRRDHLVEHLRNFHHIDIPKRRPGERSAHPLGLPNYQ
ncbi:hypothetical protein BU26DRAFT_550094 [Trematosphaeria pertusa]|uniref:C2H2-type domain-containing protein n=1 Tax=Trematosphaeria pertusa TaxID=390896 RepID=A0A6A6IH36_9PLEO|nr:uncharacterized protein BU26DRAFT_550094 [Trematosphaeria pertusa]KAF2249731.1 hypothetical protein BU26DRAFT_550094 [Trematosphaeria pertusa]